MTDVSKNDKNFAPKDNIDNATIASYNVRECEAFKIYGVYHDSKQYRRIPAELAEATSKGVVEHSTRTAGGRVRFKTNSPYIAIKAILPEFNHMAHMPPSGSTGFDCYIDGRYAGSFIPHATETVDCFERVINNPNGEKVCEVQINFPLYNGLSELYVGLHKDARVEPPEPYEYPVPVVFYGSSITQGGCASRPGMSYQAILSRDLNFDYINLGFSGSAKGEKPMVEYLASLDMSVFVMDYDHNAPNPEHLEKTHKPLFDAVREKHPDIPIIMLSRPRYYLTDDHVRRREIIKKTYEAALAAGDEKVYFIDGQTLYSGSSDLLPVEAPRL